MAGWLIFFVSGFTPYYLDNTAGSFVLPDRAPDEAFTFYKALLRKYVTDLAEQRAPEIYISGKTVEEVGFAKIHELQSSLPKLRVIELDDAHINGLGLGHGPDGDEGGWLMTKELELKCERLSLKGNLINDWEIIRGICSASGGESLLELGLEYVFSYSGSSFY